MNSEVQSRHLLIVGSGSVGKRHADNFRQLGCRISCFDPRQDRREELAALFENPIEVYSDYGQALDSAKFDGVVICSPTSFHPDQAILALDANLPVLMEKPLAVSLDQAIQLKSVADSKTLPILMGYTWRWWEPLRQVHEMLERRTIGQVLHVQFHLSAHLADWHPWENYQNFFMAKKSLGGGALLDESHWIDLMIWFFGMPNSIIGKVEKISGLDIETDDNVDFLASYDSGLRTSVHLDLFGRPHERFIRFVGENGSIFWSSDPNETRITRASGKETEILQHDCQRNEMFMSVAAEFIDILSGKQDASCTLDDGINALQVIEAIRQSSELGKSVSVSNYIRSQ